MGELRSACDMCMSMYKSWMLRLVSEVSRALLGAGSHNRIAVGEHVLSG